MYAIGQKLKGVYPPEAAQWCNDNCAMMVPIDGGFEIQAVPKPTLTQVAQTKLAAIDAETSSAITAGFEYTVDGVSYHFSYDAFDQQNFADTANVALLAQMGGKGLPESVAWNAYKNWQNGQGDLVRLTFTAESFLALYTGGAVAHKAARMAEGGARKAALAEAVARGATAEELEAI